MARIPEQEIERLKSEVSVERLVEAAGIVLSRSGKDCLGKCPFHADDTASLVVTPTKNLWHCFGCGVGGGPIDWVIKKDGVSFRHAVERLREGCIVPSSSSLAAGAAAVKRSSVRALPAPVALDADDQGLLDQVIGYYHETLKTSPEALAYLKSRGLDHPELVDRFRLGFANRTLGLRLPEKNRLAGEAIRTRLQRIGVLRASGHEHFNGSLVVPVVNEAGEVTEVYGRKITAGLRAGTALHLYLPGPHRGVWNLEGLRAAKEVIVCEALIDAMSFWCAGYRNVTAAYGVEGLTEEMLELFRRNGSERVLIAYDRDEAGDRGADKLAGRLIALGIEPWRIQFPRGMDANDYACKVTPAERSLGIVIRKAAWLGKGAAPARAAPIANGDPLVVPAPDTPQVVLAQVVLPLAAESPAGAAKEEPLAPLPASPAPSAPMLTIDTEQRGEDVLLTFGEGEDARRYRVRGLAKNLAREVMRVNVLASRLERFHVDTFDLYNAKHRGAFVAQAAVELALPEPIVKQDLGRLLLKLEALQDEAITQALAPKEAAATAMSDPEREAALALLQSPDLIDRIAGDLTAAGLVGERINKLVGYLAAVSRKLDRPLAVLVQSSSAAGKSSLMEAILAMVPAEDRVKYSAMTGQSLFYMSGSNLKHKILAIAEEAGAQQAAYALKLLQSEGELTIASTGKDPVSGNLVTQEYRVEGPVMLFTTTTALDIDEELKNRCLVLSVDESRAQTQAIHRLQRERRSLAGLLRKDARHGLVCLHQNAQRLLRPLAVLNPFAAQLAFPDQATRTRRDHEKYLTLIDTIALLHQHQRPTKTATGDGGAQPIEYVEVSLADIALANEIAHEVLGRSLDELPPQTRRLLGLLDRYVGTECARQSIERAVLRFTRRTLREAIGWGDTQLKVHLGRLIELEYVIAHRRGPAIEYELFYAGGGEDGAPFVPGLIDVQTLRAAITTADRAGVNADRSAPGRGVVGPRSGGGRGAETHLSPSLQGDSDESIENPHKTYFPRGTGKHPSYPQEHAVPVLPLAAGARERA